MLVLSRKVGECVWIDESIRVKVLDIQGGRVKLGFLAPPEVAVQREELRAGQPADRLTAGCCCTDVGDVFGQTQWVC